MNPATKLGDVVKKELDRTGKVSTELVLPATLWGTLKKEGYPARVNPDELCRAIRNIEISFGFTGYPLWRKFSLAESNGNQFGKYYCIARLFFEGKVYRGKESENDPVTAMLLAYHDAVQEYAATTI